MENENKEVVVEITMEDQTKSELDKWQKMQNQLVDQKIKNNKTLATVAGCVGAVNILVVVGSLALGDWQMFAQNTGTVIAMSSYAVGNALMAKEAKKEKQLTIMSPEEKLNIIDVLRNKLQILKSKCTQTQLQQYTATGATVGFATSFIASLFTNVEAMADRIPAIVVIGGALSGVVAVASAWLAKTQSKRVKYLKEDITETEQELEEQQTLIKK